MRLPRTLWFVPALVACTLQMAFACGEDQKASVGQLLLKNARTVFVSVMLTNSGFVRDVEVLSGPTPFGKAAINAVKQRRYNDKVVWGTEPAGNSMRHVWLTVTFPRKNGSPPKIRPGVDPGVSSCVQAGHPRLVLLPPSVQPSWLTSWEPVMPVLAPDTVKVRVINVNNSQPMPKQGVFVQLVYEEPTKVSPPLHIETNANGEAQFTIPEPVPEHLDVRLALTSEHWHCACWLMTDTQKVLNSGVLEIPSKVPNASNSSVNAEPKQIVFVVRPFTFFEKLLHPFLKQ